ncbi:hypothetical protein [Paucisalibacillus globulus]|uniref:hypothetical protein n=1 Tax=Paucisalibacillus globulus TaxID=351095 RepID=UPI00047CBEF9|nr:hypothetical protein [Paucisalibacillus globulus]
MVLWKTFLYSLQLPRKQSVFKLNRIPMDITVFYMFIMLFIVSIPSLIERLTETTSIGADMNIIFKLIYFFMFYYLPLTIMVFLLITFLAYLFTWIARGMQRKLKLQILWKMIAYTTTIPFILYTVIAIIFPFSDTYLLFSILFTTILVIKIITVYPKRKVNNKTNLS